jgi:CheY-like chemotaxis protein
MKKTILVVDDSEFVRNYHSHILQQAGFDVITAMDGSDGLEKLYARTFDLVMTDISSSAACVPNQDTRNCPSSSFPRKARAKTR